MVFDCRQNPSSSPFVFCLHCSKLTSMETSTQLMTTAFRVTDVGIVPYGCCKDCSPVMDSSFAGVAS